MTHPGIRIRRERERRGLTQPRLADDAGVDYKTLQRIEGGKVKRSASITILLDHLGLPHEEPEPEYVGESDAERLLREVEDGPFWAEATRRFFRNAADATTTDDAQPGRTQPKRGRHAPIPDIFLDAQARNQAKNTHTE